MKIITINREYGAGGHTIGREVAKQLGIEFYDKDIIRETARAVGMDVEEIEKQEERISKSESIIRSITPISYDQKNIIYDYQRNIILQLAAKKAPFVILGHTANIILEEAGYETIDVLITADGAHRILRAKELLGIENNSELHKAFKKMDHDRHAYYAYYTGKKWGNTNDFDLVVDSGTFGYDKCVQLICEAAK